MGNDTRPIGFFDSGIGGLSVMLCAMERLPKENFIYYGDNANAPYGDRTEHDIQELTMKAGDFLAGKGVKTMVIACNTATSAAVKLLREVYNMPVVSIEPAIKPAYENCSANGRILVMATKATLSQRRYHELVSRIGCADKLLDMPCCGLVELIERGDFESAEIDEYLAEKFAAVHEEISGIVIGCTHYSFVTERIRLAAKGMLRGECAIYDGMYGTVRQLGRVLYQKGLENQQGNGTAEVYTSGDESCREMIETIIGKSKGTF